MKTFLRLTLRLLLLGGLVAALRRAFDSGRLGARARGDGDGGAGGGETPTRARLALVGDGPSPFTAGRPRPDPAAGGVAVATRVAPPVVVGAADPIAGDCPPGFPVKGKRGSGIFHVPGGLSYDRTVPDRCYATPADAEADGLRAARR